jgi:hydroxymethylglutaryl-CoA lyase
LADEIARITHDAGGTLEVIIATAWDCPFTGPTPLATTTQVANEAVARGADAFCLGDTPPAA